MSSAPLQTDSMLARSQYFIREHVGVLKLSNTYDILDPESHTVIGVAKEEISPLIHVMRFLIHKRILPTQVNVYEGDDPQTGQLLFSIKRGLTFMRARVDVVDARGELVGWFKSKLFSVGGGFRVYSRDDVEVAEVKGDWKGWNFKFLLGGKEIGCVTKKWSGLGKELFTTADSYMISLNGESNAGQSVLLLAAGLAIDTIFKEN